MAKIATIKQMFRSSIKRGTGEAHLIMQKYLTIDFSTDIIKASLKNYAYDGQTEGSRVSYLFELIALSKQQDKILKAILKGLATERKDTWSLDQLFDLAAIFAKQGDTEARRAIYENFQKRPIPHSDWLGEEVIMNIDGIEGLKYIASVKGKILAADPEQWEDSWTVDSFQKKHPTINVYKELEHASKHNKNIKVYLDTIKKDKAKFREWKRPRYNYEIVTERIHSNVFVPLPPVAVKELKSSDIRKLADDFLKEKDRVKLEKYMRVFDVVKFPYDYQPILSLAKSEKEKDRLVKYACASLKYFKGSDIRKFAVDRLARIRIPGDYLDLLVSNYKKGDDRLLTDIVNRSRNENDVHNLVWSYINIYQTNRTKECRKPLEAIYKKLTCGIHRAEIVQILIDNKVLSKQLRREIKFDSYEEVRQLCQCL